MSNMVTGIYRIFSQASGKFYFGSAINIRKRWSWHKAFLRKGAHPNLHLQRAWNKYGEPAFLFEVWELCSRRALRKTEQKYLDRWVGNQKCYNIASDAYVPGRGLIPSPEANRKRSKTLMGRHLSEEHKQHIGQANTGKRYTQQNRRQWHSLAKTHKQNIGKALQGENAGLAKLTEKQVKQIRTRYGVFSYNQLARQYDVDKKTIINVVKCRTWKHL